MCDGCANRNIGIVTGQIYNLSVCSRAHLNGLDRLRTAFIPSFLSIFWLHHWSYARIQWKLVRPMRRCVFSTQKTHIGWTINHANCIKCDLKGVFNSYMHLITKRICNLFGAGEPNAKQKHSTTKLRLGCWMVSHESQVNFLVIIAAHIMFCAQNV